MDIGSIVMLDKDVMKKSRKGLSIKRMLMDKIDG